LRINRSTTVGFLTAGFVFVASVMLSLDNWTVLIDFNSALIVIGGTIATSLICFSFSDIKKLLRVFFLRVIGKNKKDYEAITAEIVVLAKAYRQGDEAYERALKSVTEPFLRDAGEVLFWLESEVTPEKLRRVLETRADTHFANYSDDANIFRSIAKYPPALGLMGTTLGLIALLQGLGSAGAASKIGPAMAVALMTTLYGLAITNFLLAPIAEQLTKQTKEDYTARLMVIEGIMLIQEGEPVRFVEESVKSFLLPSQRPARAEGEKAA
jgi:chemotaxis protein MotA